MRLARCSSCYPGREQDKISDGGRLNVRALAFSCFPWTCPSGVGFTGRKTCLIYRPLVQPLIVRFAQNDFNTLFFQIPSQQFNKWNGQERKQRTDVNEHFQDERPGI